MSVGNATVQWRKYGAGVPPYWQGSFTRSDVFAWYPPNAYIRVDIKPSQDITAEIRSL